MPIISAAGLFCCDKFEETPNENVVNMYKLIKSYFSKKESLKSISYNYELRIAVCEKILNWKFCCWLNSLYKSSIILFYTASNILYIM